MLLTVLQVSNSTVNCVITCMHANSRKRICVWYELYLFTVNCAIVYISVLHCTYFDQAYDYNFCPLDSSIVSYAY